jgi:WD40 repeat protein
VNFDGPVRVADAAAAGTATITLSFDAWKGAPIAPTTHRIRVLPPKPGPREEPVAANLIATFVQPERRGIVRTVEFSPDSSRLFTAGYPTGVVQIWDVATRKELRRIEAPTGLLGSAWYALLTPDWKTLYVPVVQRSARAFDGNGKRLYRFEYSGKIRVWDMATGKEKSPLRFAAGTAPARAWLAPGGRWLVCLERPSYDSSNPQPDVMLAWDLDTGKKWKLCDGFARPSFSPDGKTAAVAHGLPGEKSFVKLLDLATGKELVHLDCPDRERFFSIGPVSPDGSMVAVLLGGKKGAPVEVWLLDGRTLAIREKLVGKGDPESYGWGSGTFTPDGKRFVTLDGVGNVLVWNAARRRLERTVPIGKEVEASELAISPDSTMLAVGWSPKVDKDRENARESDPRDLPQPRVSLLHLDGATAPRILIAPHGYVGALTFSPDGKMLAFGGTGAIHLFDLRK